MLLATVWDQTTVVEAATSLKITSVRVASVWSAGALQHGLGAAALHAHAFVLVPPGCLQSASECMHAMVCCCTRALRLSGLHLACVACELRSRTLRTPPASTSACCSACLPPRLQRFKDTVLGRVKVPVSDVAAAGRLRSFWPLQGALMGELEMVLQWIPAELME